MGVRVLLGQRRTGLFAKLIGRDSLLAVGFGEVTLGDQEPNQTFGGLEVVPMLPGSDAELSHGVAVGAGT